MRKFLCKESGAILLVNSKEIARQYAKSDAYEEIKEVEAPKEKTIKDYNKKELKETKKRSKKKKSKK